MKRLFFLAMLAVALSLVLAAPAFAAVPIPTAEYEPSGGVLGGSAPLESPLAQSFTATVTGTLTSADAWLQTYSDNTGSVYAELYNLSGIYGSTSVPTGSPLAVSAPVATYSPSGVVTFSFTGSNAIPLIAGRQYALVVNGSSGQWASSMWTDDPPYSGNTSRYSTNLEEWVSTYAGDDFYFRVSVVEPAAKYEPSGASGSVLPLESWLAQSFTTTVTGTLSSADAWLDTPSNDPGSVYAELYHLSGTYGSTSVPTGDPLAVSAPVAAYSPSRVVTFSFSGANAIPLTAGEQYALVLKYDGWVASWRMSAGSGDAPYSGNMSYYVSSLGAWIIESIREGDDFYFRVWTKDDPVGPDDLAGPVTSNVAATPNPTPVNAQVDLTADISDTSNGGSPVEEARYQLVGESEIWQALGAGDGAFDAATEAVAVSLTAPATPGVYEIQVQGKDAAGNWGAVESVFLAVYDPSAGFVTGSGWIWSPAGAWASDPSMEGRARFGFVSRYQKGAALPTGRTDFVFRAGDLNFESTTYDWLVVAGAKAQYKGSGTINGAGSYGFMVSAIDGSLIGPGEPDLFRIKIWDKATGNIAYDNQMGTAESGDPTTALGGGAIVIHK